MKAYSIEQRLIQNTLATVSGMLLLFGLLVAISVTFMLNREYDQHLLAKARVLVTLVKDRIRYVELDFADEFMPEFEASTSPEYFQLSFADGRVLERSSSLKRLNAELFLDPSTMNKRLTNTESSHQFHDLILPDGRSGRQVQIVFVPQIPRRADRTAINLSKQSQMVLVVAKERESLSQLCYAVYAILVVSALLVIFIIKFLLRHHIRGDLAPLKELQSQIERMDTERIQERLQLCSTPTELAELVAQFNRMLERIEQSFTREQRFSADAAHELRTPIAEIRAMAEVALRHAGYELNNPIATENEFYGDILDACMHMQSIVNNLLLLAKCENRQVILTPVQVDVRERVNNILQKYQGQIAEKNLKIIRNLDEICVVQISANEFELILHNLINNAIEYSPQSSKIEIEFSRASSSLTISNLTDNLTEKDLPLLFERLWRKDLARSSAQHSGIGLALVKAYAELLGLDVTALLEHNCIFSVTLTRFFVA